MLVSLEIMLNAVNVNFAAFGHHLLDERGQILALFVIAVAAAEAAIGLGLVIALSSQQAWRQDRAPDPVEVVITPLLAILVSAVAALLIVGTGERRRNLREFWSVAAGVLQFGLVASMIPRGAGGSHSGRRALPASSRRRRSHFASMPSACCLPWAHRFSGLPRRSTRSATCARSASTRKPATSPASRWRFRPRWAWPLPPICSRCFCSTKR